MKTITALSVLAALIAGAGSPAPVRAQSAAFSQQFQDDDAYRVNAQKAQEDIGKWTGLLKDIDLILSGFKELTTTFEDFKTSKDTYLGDCRKKYDIYETKKRANDIYAEIYKAPVTRCQDMVQRLNRDHADALATIKKVTAEVQAISDQIGPLKDSLGLAEAELRTYQRRDSLRKLIDRESVKVKDFRDKASHLGQ